jgi:hypothetical protein
MDTVDVLRKARERIAARGGWTQRGFALDHGGNEVDVDKACRFCMLGALHAVTESQRTINDARLALARAIGCDRGSFSPIIDFNDAPSTTHADIIALFDRAIDAEERAAKGE